MSTTGISTPNPPPNRRDVADVVCLGCGCLCDDLTLRVEGGRIVAITPDCPLGLSWFRFMSTPARSPIARIDGREVGLDAAIAEAASRLSRARSPLVLGLSGSTIEAQREAVAIADRIGAVIDVAHAADAAPAIAAFQMAGAVSATLGEVKNRADVVVYWGVDPDAYYPRHTTRYAAHPVGRFVPEGREGRYVVIVVDPAAEVQTAADEVIRVPASAQGEALRVLGALVRGVTLKGDEVEATCGVTLAVLEPLAERLKQASYGALFHTPWLWRHAGDTAVEFAWRLARDLNRHTHFVALSMGGQGNPAGAEAVLSWQTGFPRAVDLGSGVPRYRPEAASAECCLRQGTCDAVLLVGHGASHALSVEAEAALDGLPLVQIGPGANRGVAIDTAAPAVAAGGTVMRCDGVTLPLRPIIATDRPDEAWVLRRLRVAIEPGTETVR
jgi:formylmethanofuran dehydrogenase subunit B